MQDDERLGSDSDRHWRTLESLVSEYVDRIRRGEKLTPAAFVAEHPEKGDDLQDLLRGSVALETAASEMDQHPPTSFGEFEILRELGRGGMGVVYEAVQPSLDRKVALKTLPYGTESYRKRFRREAQAAAALDHPGIVPVHGFGEENGQPWCAMQLVEGPGLDRVLEALRNTRDEELPELPRDRATSAARRLRDSELGPELELEEIDGTEVPEGASALTPEALPRERAVYFRNVATIVRDAAEAVAYAHARGVVHRDLKPGNLLLDPRGKVRVTDFGLCKIEGSESLSVTGEVLGTLRYMSPEQFEGRADVRSDVYGLGLVLYELLALEPPFAERSRAELIQAVLHGTPPALRRTVPEVPRDLETIVARATAKLPEERYGTALALAEDLRAFLEGRAIAARPPSAFYLLRLAARRHRLAVGVAVGGFALLAAATLLYVVMLQSAERARARQVYVAQLAVAEAALANGDVGLAEKALEEAPAEFRRWEWEYLRRQTDESTRRIFVAPDGPLALALSPDGGWLAVGTQERVVILDVATGDVRHEIPGILSEVWLCWAPDGTRLAIGDWSGKIRVASLGAGGLELAERQLGVAVRAVAVSPRSDRVACALRDYSIAIVDLALTGDVRRLEGHSGYVDHMDFLPDGRLLTGSWDGTTRLWNLDRGESRVLDRREGLRALAVDAQGEHFAVGTSQGDVVLGRLSGDPSPSVLKGHRRSVRDLVFSPDGQRLASAADDHTVGIWEVRDAARSRLQLFGGSTLRYRLRGHRRGVMGVEFSPDGRHLYSVSPAGAVLEWDLWAPRSLEQLRGQLPDAWSVCFSGDSSTLITGGPMVRVWDLATRRVRRVLGRGAPLVSWVAVSPDDRHVAASCADGSTWVWELATGRVLFRSEASGSPARGCTWIAEGRRVISGTEDGELLVFDPFGTARTRRLDLGHGLRTFAVDARGSQIAVSLADGSIAILETENWTERVRITGGQGRAMSLAFSPTGVHLAGVTEIRTLRLWEATTGRPTGWESVQVSETGLDVRPMSVAYHPDGTRLVVGSSDGSLRVFDADRGTLLLGFEAHRPWALAVCFDPTGRLLASTGSGGDVRLWGLLEDDLGQKERRDQILGRALNTEERVDSRIAILGSPEAVIDELLEDRTLDGGERELRLAVAFERWGEPQWVLARVRELVAVPGRDAERYQLAEHMAQSLYRLDRSDPGFQAAVGMAAFRLDRVSEALPWFVRSRPMAAGPARADALTLALYAMALARSGTVAEARAILEVSGRARGAADVESTLLEAHELVERLARSRG